MTHLLASAYPTAQVYGVDLAAVPEVRHGKLSNLEYVQGDILNLIGVDSRFDLGSFDYIFHRLLIFGVTNWPGYIASVGRLLRPGGTLEIQEPNMNIQSAKSEPLGDSMLWYRSFRPDAVAMGLDVEIGAKLVKLFRASSIFEDVNEDRYSLPIATSADREDLRAAQEQLPGLFTLITTKVCSARKSEEEVQRLVRDLRETWDRGFQKGDHFAMYAVTGRGKMA